MIYRIPILNEEKFLFNLAQPQCYNYLMTGQSFAVFRTAYLTKANSPKLLVMITNNNRY